MAHGITKSDSIFSVRERPWHGLGAVLDDYPTSIDDALEKSGLGWTVSQQPVFIPQEVSDPDDPTKTQTLYVPLKDAGDVEYRANIRSDNGAILGVVTDEYKVVGNREAFQFLDALIGSDLYFETAGSLQGGKRVWVLARLPEYIEVGGDETDIYVYVANSHDGSLAVTSATTPVRIVCQNTLGFALNRSAYGANAQRTFKFRHTGNLAVKFAEARKVLGISIDYAQQFKVLGDRLATEPFSKDQFDKKVVRELFPIEDDLGKRGVTLREQARERLLTIFDGKGEDGDTTGNSPRSKWTAVNAVGEYADWSRRYTRRTNQVQRSFEDTTLKQRALDLVVAA